MPIGTSRGEERIVGGVEGAAEGIAGAVEVGKGYRRVRGVDSVSGGYKIVGSRDGAGGVIGGHVLLAEGHFGEGRECRFFAVDFHFCL